MNRNLVPFPNLHLLEQLRQNGSFSFDRGKTEFVSKFSYTVSSVQALRPSSSMAARVSSTVIPGGAADRLLYGVPGCGAL